MPAALNAYQTGHNIVHTHTHTRSVLAINSLLRYHTKILRTMCTFSKLRVSMVVCRLVCSCDVVAVVVGVVVAVFLHIAIGNRRLIITSDQHKLENK